MVLLTRPEPETDSVAAVGHTTGFIAFAVGPARLAIPLAEVQEVLRPPVTMPIPLGPPSLKGLARLRTMVLPIISLRHVLGIANASDDDDEDSGRVLVINHLGHPVGLLVDQMEGLITVDQDRVVAFSADDGADPGRLAASRAMIDPGLLKGTIRTGSGERLIVFPGPVIDRQFSDLGAVSTRFNDLAGGEHTAPAKQDALKRAAQAADSSATDLRVVAFAVRGQDFALPVEAVREVIRLPDNVTHVPRARTHLLGMISLRDQLLPLVDLARLFQLDSDRPANARVVVVQMPDSVGQNIVIGAVVDQLREILTLPANRIDPVPPLMARAAEFEDVTGIARLDQGRRLIPLLSPARLFQLGDVMQSGLAGAHRADQEKSDQGEGEMTAGAGGDLRGDDWLLFKLGDASYGLSIKAVQEVLRAPESLIPLPGAPDFVIGMVNLRGGAVPVIDLRRLMGLPAHNRVQDRPRVIVLALRGLRVGLLTDALSGIERIAHSAIGVAPTVSAAQHRLIRRVAGLDGRGRNMVLLMEAEELMNMDRLVELRAIA